MNDWFDAEQRIERAQQLCESHRWEDALKEVEAAIDINPHNALWHAQRGYLLDQLERFEDAIDAFRNAHELEPNDPDIAVALGVDLVRIERLLEALQIFTDLINELPEYEPAYTHLIMVYAELGDHDKAEEMFYLALQLSEDNPTTYFNMGNSLAMRGDYSRAIHCWEKTHEIDPTFAGVHERIAQAYRAQNDLVRAREAFLAELREAPGDIDLMFDLGELEVEAGNYTQAISRFMHIIELEPDNATAHLAVGEVLLRTGHPQKALDSLQKALAYDPELEGLNLRTGEALLLLGRTEEARPYLERAVEEEQDAESPLMALGNCLLQQGEPAKAENLFRRVIAVHKHVPFAHHNLAVCHFLAKRFDIGLEHCIRAIEMKPDYVMAMHKAALACIQLRRWADARSYITRALEIDPDHESLRLLKKQLWRHRTASWIRRVFHVGRGRKSS